MDVNIREAKPDDSAEIANVHINAWREAYKTLLPQYFLGEKPLFFKNRYEFWKKTTGRPSEIIYVAESKENGIVGFCNVGKGRDNGRTDQGEVYCIYLLEKYHKKKIGLQLLRSCFIDLVAIGLSSAYLWVLDKNPTIDFYKRTGAQESGITRSDMIGNKKVLEHCYFLEYTQIFYL